MYCNANVLSLKLSNSNFFIGSLPSREKNAYDNDKKDHMRNSRSRPHRYALSITPPSNQNNGAELSYQLSSAVADRFTLVL